MRLLRMNVLVVLAALTLGAGCLGDPIPQGLHVDSQIVGRADVLGEWVRFNELGEEEYRIVFNERRSFDIYYYRHRRAVVWGMYEKEDGKLSVRYLGGDIPFGCGEPGRYTIGNVEDELLVSLVSDPCQTRAQFFQGVWQRSGPQRK